ncbi:dipicolinate synthase subunit DpsA [Desulfoscipio gibsoniae]|uniref:Glutamyl-tRNA reductase n=1 Tax=Desulfoscipio gibsoniae DSM 7213 TaxID=767817 RepID=R4KI49_9FIRM|nr:dipicolinate synthase subunit DpsA [Desulfoscipio gibsoniae]AGL01312.1 glutamyl-tRNA reductase [Desulfoscipio gibsoniae DSM 7213]
MQNLTGLAVAVMGGDAREVTLVESLTGAGATVKTLGLPVKGPNIVPCSEPEECLAGVQALILPVPGVNEQMELFSAYLKPRPIITGELLSLLPAGTPVLVGVARKPLCELLEKNALKPIELMKLDEVAILNSIPSAEGAVQMAMERLPITIHGSSAMVLGFGRTGQTMAQLLMAMHAHTTVVARNPAQLARATAMGLKALHFNELVDYLRDVDVIFNTIPAPVINGEILQRLPSATLIIDLASAPGGTDFVKAGELGIEAVLAPGLPGKVAPKTAGMILARVVPGILLQKIGH